MDCRLFDLSHLGLIAVSGADAIAFLQGQFTNDMRKLTADYSQLGSHCNPKGRMLALFRLVRQGDTIYIQLPKDNLQPLLGILNKYRLRSQVQLRDATDELALFGIAGADAIELLVNSITVNEQITAVVPEQSSAVTHNQPFMLVRMPGETPRIQVLGNLESINQLWDSLLNKGATIATTNDWILLEIRAGIPAIYQATADAFVPQMTNLHLLDGVSFAKGCYNGQEVVARVQHLGTLKRSMFRAEVVTTKRPNPGDVLYSTDSESGQGAGRIVEACPTRTNCYELLVVVETEVAQNSPVQLDNAEGPTIRFL